ncbi:MAG: hypothetical protein OXN90_14905 [Gemmatimonadota bacterium]|nr:hypothetical protein [Gemmatimonadota bacterium]
MKKTIACCLLLLLSGVPTWAEPLELPRRLGPLEAALAEQWAEQPKLGQQSMPTAAAAPSKEQRSRKKLYLSAALAVGAGAVAYWSKERANAAYDRYLRSASVVRQQRKLDEAKRFDRVTGAAFIGMEVGLVLSSYLLFFRSRS